MDSSMERCNQTGKLKYSSQAKAERALRQNHVLRRVYFCDFCESFHTTKVGKTLALELGLIEPIKKKKERRKAKEIKNRLKQLTEKVLKTDNLEKIHLGSN